MPGRHSKDGPALDETWVAAGAPEPAAPAFPPPTSAPVPGLSARTEPADPIGARVTSLVVEQALATLPFEQRAALVLVDIQGYSVEEAATILDCAPGTVKSRCSRGRARLLPQLQHLRNPDSGPHVPPQRTPDKSGTTTAEGGRTA
ncbi:MAG: sigma factor-like helix-turn-helix DNA-binding protein [Actinomycetes bacterium]